MAPGTVALNMRQHIAAWSVEDDHQDVAADAAGVAGRYRLAPARDGADTPAGAAASVTGYCSAEISTPLACAIALRAAGASAIALSITKSWIVPDVAGAGDAHAGFPELARVGLPLVSEYIVLGGDDESVRLPLELIRRCGKRRSDDCSPGGLVR